MIADFCVTRKARHTSVVVSPSPPLPLLYLLPTPTRRVQSKRLLLDLGEDLRVTVEVVLLATSHASATDHVSHLTTHKLTSSPSLMGLPPQPGRRTRSPAFTLVGTTLPSLSAAPGPTAMTVASGRGWLVVDEGRKMPLAVFYCAYTRISHADKPVDEGEEANVQSRA